MDALALEAVVGPDGEVEVLDRQGEVRGERGVGRRRAHVDALGLDVELTGQAEQLDEGLAGGRERVTRGHRVLGLDVDHEAVEVGALLDTGGLDLVGHGQHRAVDGVDRDAADLLVAGLVLLRRDVATATLDGQLHLDGALVVQRRDVQARVVDLDAGRRARCRPR